MANLYSVFVGLLFTVTISLPISISQQAPLPPNQTCNGIFISYAYNTGHLIPPRLLGSDPTHQPYRFQSTLTILNNGLEELKSWRVSVGFENREFLVSASNAVLADGTSLPANVSNGTVFVGYPVTDLKSAAQTAGDENQMQARVELVGTQFGIGAPYVPLPSTLALANDGFVCPGPTKQANEIHLCCVKDAATPNTTTLVENLLPRQEGDLTIMYDVIRSYESYYWAQVTVSNHNPIRRLDSWQLSWEWMRDEFINSMKGAYPKVVDTTDCIFGRQGEHYKDMDFSTALNCERRPTIIDLPLFKTSDAILGSIPFCCRNGTILPPSMDPSKSKSVFQMQVYKMPPDINRTQLTPPQNWKINSTHNTDYQCGSPVRVAPSLFPDPTGIPSESAAIASWQVVCNITHSKVESPKCCVSFSSFFNDSVVPCNTCACGCNNSPSNVCSASAHALLLRPDALLLPFENRTKLAQSWADLNNWDLPNPLPCGDNCGVSINWHLNSDYRDGWTVRMTLFNWGEAAFEDWFAAVQLDKAVPGFEKVYSFNGTVVPSSNNTIFMQGVKGLSYLLAETDGKNPKKDPRVPGTQQSVILFTKKTTPGINVARGDGFPTKVYFNGEECSLPTMLPSDAYRMSGAAIVFSFFLALLHLVFLQQ